MTSTGAHLTKKTPSFTSYISSGSSSQNDDTEHGISNPLHWDNLSEEVRLQLEKTSLTSSGQVEKSGSGKTSAESTEKKRRHSQPPGTFLHTVGPRDTLTSIAARYDTTPSFLKKINHLTSQLIFSGQVLFIPDKDYKADSPTSPPPDSQANPSDDQVPPLSPRSSLHPGHAERLRSSSSDEGRKSPKEIEPPKPLSEEEAKKLDQECYERFIKVSVKHITDGMGVVSGVLLVTPNAVMFDPDVMDPLVIEHGADTYGMITPMQMIMSAALYHDIAAMRVKGLPDEQNPPMQKSAVYHGEDLSHSDVNSPVDEQPPGGTIAKEDDCVCQNTSCDGTLTSDIEASDEGILINFDKVEDSSDRVNDPSEENKNSSFGDMDESKSVLGQPPAGNINIDNVDDGVVGKLKSQPSLDIAIQTDVIDTSLNTSSAIETSTLPVGVTLPTDKRPSQLDISGIVQKDISDNLHPASEEMRGLSPHMQIGSITYFQYEEQKSSGDPQADLKTIASSSSWVDIPHESNLKNFVDFSSGLFSKKQDEVGKVKDIHEIPCLVRQSSATWYSEASTGSDTSSSKSGTSQRGIRKNKKPSKSKKNKKRAADIPVEVVSVVRPNEMKALFQTPADIIPSPAVQYEDPPLFLCLKVGMPVNKAVSKTCPIESYNRKKKKPEYWFSIPRDKVDHLYAFFIQWSPNIYGSEEEIDPKSHGFVVVESDEEDNLFVLDCNDHHKKLSKQMSKDWEIVNVEEARRRLSLLDVEDSLPLPDLLEPSIILCENHVKQLSKNLPPRAEGYPWSLIYSTERHGFSLKTLYRNMNNCDSPTLLVVKDTFGSLFGVMSSCALTLNDHFYGTGESFLYTFSEDSLLVYRWSGENNFFIRGSKESLAFGAGEGSFGLWLDSDFYHGRTKSCKTYNSPPLTCQEDFFIAAIEAWGFFSD